MLKVAWRNARRNGKRTSITMTTVAFGTFFIMFMRFFAYGSHEETIWNAVGLSSGYIQIAANGWIENKPLERALDVDDEMIQKIKKAGANTVTPRIFGYGLASYTSSTRFISLRGVDPDKEIKVTTLHKKMQKGTYLTRAIEKIPHPYQKGRSISVYSGIIGYGLAENLGVGIGDIISVTGSQFDGAIGAILIKVTGIYKSFEVNLDTSTVVTTLEAADDLFALTASLNTYGEGDSHFEDDLSLGSIDSEASSEKGQSPAVSTNKRRYTSLVVGASNHRQAEKLVEKLKEIFPTPPEEKGTARENSMNYDPVVHNWEELIPGLIQLVVLDQISAEITLAFLILIVAFGVLNTVQMSMHERYKEFGIMMAIGTRATYIIKMVLTETVFIMLPGLLIGSILGIAAGIYFDMNPIILSGHDAEMMTDVGFAPVMRTIVDSGELVIALLSIVIPSFVFAVFAAIRVVKLKPVEAINSMN